MQPALGLAIRGTDRTFELADGTHLTVGRSKDCEICLEDTAVSRRHCTIEAVGTGVVITDLESANGTFLNERLIHTASAVPGDTIRVGGTVLAVTSPVAVPHRLDSTLSDDDTPASVIKKRFEPARFDWLTTLSSSADTGSSSLSLLQRAERHLSMLHRVSEMLATARDISGLADSTLDAILEVIGCDRAAFILRRPGGDVSSAEVAAARGLSGSVDRFNVSRTLIADVIEKGVSTFAYDAVNDARFKAGSSVVGQQVRSVMCVPLRTTDDVQGALYVDSLSAPGKFSETDLELLAALGNQAGVALHRVRLLSEIERLLLDTIRAIAATIDAKDGYTHRHSERVAVLSARIAAEIGLSAEQQKTVQLAALLHDLGKIAVPDSILNKPSQLTPAEFEEMKKHPVHGARILSNIQSPAVRAVLPGVQYHHERWDGSGYPDGLRGENIPLLGRLLGVADYFDALTSARAYRPAMTVNEAIGLVVKAAGTHFDPRMVEAMMDLHERGELLPRVSDELTTEISPLVGTQRDDAE
jgi:HD-GYP domain-containing protein (c-di-GMP phosphodiesterase class II)/pSer/pThr/pTyr-binding forkhead associated (FHA) protein